MQLKDFISETISQLVEGLAIAQENVSAFGGRVTPYVRNPVDKNGSLYGITQDKLPVIFVDFDVSIDAREAAGTRGGIGVVTGMLNLGSAGESNENRQQTNKIRFRIPVALPLHKHPNDICEA
jgi:hypothetical protein